MSTLILTRPSAVNQLMIESLKRYEYTDYLSLPALTLVPLNTPPVSPRDFDVIVFVSAYAAKLFLDACTEYYPEQMGLPSRTVYAGVGVSTTKAVSRHPFVHSQAHVIHPVQGIDSEALLPLLPIAAGQRLLLVRGDSGRDWLKKQLELRGVLITVWSGYQRKSAIWDDLQIDQLARLMSQPNRTRWWLTSTQSAVACWYNLNAHDLVVNWLKQEFWFAHMNILQGLTQHLIKNTTTILTNTINFNYDICLPSEDALLTKLELFHD